jgi:hypothetical protein
MRFEVLANGVVVGSSELEVGDAPMGVAAGRFLPHPAYSAIQPLVVEGRDSSQAHLALVVRVTEGAEIPSEGGVRITDYSTELGDEGIEIEVLGIPYPLYGELFPEHVTAYCVRFPITPYS